MSTRFVKGKKIFNLINLIKYNNQTIRLPIYLSIIGKGEDYKKIKKYIKDIKLDEFIHLTTLETERELNTWNSNLFIYVHFSEGETLSTSIIRALRAGKPIIASNVVGIKEMIKNKNNSNGYLVNDENYKQILKLIKKILENKKLYNELSKNSLKLFKKKYSLELSLIKYKKLINLFV
jgi:glycosyltransferase involved in cell wall biosynthesis